MSPFQEKIFTFYKKEGRDLPWRYTTDRYKILVSEVMLQQTQVSRVIEKYNQWLEKFPTVQDLAKAELSEVLMLWIGLGYNSRGKRLWELAKIVVKEYGGIIPDTVEELMKLPGIGPYTARSVLIFADNKDIATVDTNIRRIFIHEFNLKENISDKELFEFAALQLPVDRSRDWHNALMDYGATILTSKKTGIRPTTQQSTFKHSKRYYRGQILRHLTTHKKLSLSEARQKYPIQDKLQGKQFTLREIFTDMEKEGIIKKKGEFYTI